MDNINGNEAVLISREVGYSREFASASEQGREGEQFDMWKRGKMTTASENGDSDNKLGVTELQPLYPRYIEGEHRVYVDAIESAIENDREGKLHNIALSGVYGSGKSSILEKVVEDFEVGKRFRIAAKGSGRNFRSRTKSISLAPLASRIDDDIHDDGQFGGSSTESTPESNGNSVDSRTNKIQREIVKQLLYGAKPEDVPLSRFHRIHEVSVPRLLPCALCISLFLVVFLGIFFGGQLSAFGNILLEFPLLKAKLKNNSNAPIVGYLALAVFLFLLSCAVCYCLMNSNLKILQVDAGGASIKLDKGVDSYFDQYLDEIVYLFEKSKVELVVFEDLDRFESPEIFDSLRELNQILNDDPKIARKRVIRFIYAISDAVFDDQCTASSAHQSGNNNDCDDDHNHAEAFARAKFFDLIVPVVPFANPANSYQMARRTLGDKITQMEGVGDLLEDVARYIPDQRTWITIRNDFIVYCTKLHIGLEDGKDIENVLGLSPKYLLGFLIYRNYYLADAASMKNGKSKVDKIYSIARDIVAGSIPKQTKLKQEHQRKIEMVSEGHEANANAADLTRDVKTFAVSLSGLDASEWLLRVDNNDEEQLKKASTWREISSKKENEEIHIELYSGYSRVFEISPSRSTLEQYLDRSIDIDQFTWDALTREGYEIETRLKNLRTGNWAFLLHDVECKTNLDIDDTDKESAGQTLAEYLEDDLHESDTLLYHLIDGGWLRQDYKLYSTVYSDEGITRNALDFTIHHIDENAPDFYFHLDNADVKSVLKRVQSRGTSLLGQAWMLNIDILNYLLESEGNQDKETLKLVISYLCDLKDDASREFLKAFLGEEGNRTTEILELLAGRCPQILTFLTDDASDALEPAALCGYLDAVLRHLAPDIEYQVPEGFANFIRLHGSSIAALKDDSLTKERAEVFDRILKRAGYIAPELGAVGRALRMLLIDHDGYSFTRVNLLSALGTLDSSLKEGLLPPLNRIKAISLNVYRYVTRLMEAYLRMLKKQEYSFSFDDTTSTDDVDNTIIYVMCDVIMALDGAQSNGEVGPGDNPPETTLSNRGKKVIQDVIAKRADDVKVSCFEPGELKAGLSQKMAPEVCEQYDHYLFFELLDNNAIQFTARNLLSAFTAFTRSESRKAVYKWMNSKESFDSVDDISESDKMKLVVELLNVPSADCNMEKKVEFVRSLDLESPLPDELTQQIKVGDKSVFDLEKHPDAYAKLLDEKPIVTDTLTAFKMIPADNRKARLEWMKKSEEFPTYVSSQLLDPNEACDVISISDNRLRKIQQMILQKPETYLHDADYQHLLTAVKSNIDAEGGCDETLLGVFAHKIDKLGTIEKLMRGDLHSLNSESILAILNFVLSENDLSNSNIYLARDIIVKCGNPYVQMFDNKKRVLLVKYNIFSELIAKFNDFTKNDFKEGKGIWNYEQEESGVKKYRSVPGILPKLNRHIDQLKRPMLTDLVG
ncbi:MULTISPECIES: YobI family P-loop NTPase [unclassified Bifidobacterium]|uniref:YobI family P-loop NTPase n=1 Tax=unclassified Bifidobacterium TaxID=2608897 RepID=UPI003F9158FF